MPSGCLLWQNWLEAYFLGCPELAAEYDESCSMLHFSLLHQSYFGACDFPSFGPSYRALAVVWSNPCNMFPHLPPFPQFSLRDLK